MQTRLIFLCLPLFASGLHSVPQHFFPQRHKLPMFSVNPEDDSRVKKNIKSMQMVRLQSDSELDLHGRRAPMLHSLIYFFILNQGYFFQFGKVDF